MTPHPHAYEPELITRVQGWATRLAKHASIGFAEENRTFWRLFTDELHMHEAPRKLEEAIAKLPKLRRGTAPGPKAVFIDALADFCSGKPETIENLIASKWSPVATSRKQAAAGSSKRAA